MVLAAGGCRTASASAPSSTSRTRQQRSTHATSPADGAAWHIKCPLLPFDKPPVGTGDLTTGLFVASLLLGSSPRHALEATMSAYFEVMQATHDEKEYELQLVKAQDGMVRPRRWFDARQLDLEE